VQNNFDNNMPETARNTNQASNATNEIPNVNIATGSMDFPRHEQAVAPRGFLEWTTSLISLPFRLIFRTLLDLISFFMSFFEDNSIPDNYDPLANITEFTSYYNEKFGTNHPQFFNGSYSQALELAKQELRFLVVYVHQNENLNCTKFAK
jgi:FAS-associated factor 2